MGLDWLAGAKPKPGQEERFRDIQRRALGGEDLDKATVAEFQSLGIPSHEVVGAPRVGFDAAADAWFLARLRQAPKAKPSLTQRLFGRFASPAPPAGPTADEARVLAENKGYYVLELAPPCDGLPIYSNGGFSQLIDRTSFRGAFLSSCEAVIGKELLESAWESKLPDDLVSYGRTLLERAEAWGAQHGCLSVRERREPPDGEEDSPASQCHIVFAAGRWCIYWGERGHWLDAWF